MCLVAQKSSLIPQKWEDSNICKSNKKLLKGRDIFKIKNEHPCFGSSWR